MRLALAAMFLSSSRAFAVPRSIFRGRSLSSLLSPRLDGLDKPTVWHEFSPLANEYNAINLGQGFPDWDPPAFVIEAMRISTSSSGGRHANQYARSYAHMPLAQVLAEDYSERWGLSIDPATQVATAVGCTNALYCALQGLVSPGDEVLLLEPAFDIVRVDNNGCDHVSVRCYPHSMFPLHSILHR
jgi:kynurenine--oxoglutarate transaminase/cysteine-S-conjugate beta-lyase/glutamine--phenylpyruvate transaminase